MKTIGTVVAGREVYHVRSDQTVLQVARYLTERRVGAVAVLEGDRLAGIVSEGDTMSRVVAPGLDPNRVTVREIMSRDLVVAFVKESEDALRRMNQAGCRHLPVVQGDRLVGMCSQEDLLQIDLRENDEGIRWLNAYIHYTPPGA